MGVERVYMIVIKGGLQEHEDLDRIESGKMERRFVLEERSGRMYRM